MSPPITVCIDVKPACMGSYKIGFKVLNLYQFIIQVQALIFTQDRQTNNIHTILYKLQLLQAIGK